jgi:L-fucose isomerase-like protein
MATFALGLGNRSFFPPKYMEQARTEIPEALQALGHETLMMDDGATHLGAVQTREEGRHWAEWLESQQGKYDAILWSLPNFGDESGMLPALLSAGRRGDTIFLHAYPDRIAEMGWGERRDSFCGMMSAMDVLQQYSVPFVKLKPHVVHPKSDAFRENIEQVVSIAEGRTEDRYTPLSPEPKTGNENVLDGTVLLAVGARTTPFMTCRYDELTAAKNGLSIETADLSKVFYQMDQVDSGGETYKTRADQLRGYTNWKKASPEAFDQQVRLLVVLDEYIREFEPAVIGLRCWTEFQELRKISPCATVSYLNHGRDDGNVLPTACEVDLGTGLTMHTLRRYSGDIVACQDWNNNWRDEEPNKFAFMHCGPHDTAWLIPDSHYVETHGILDNDFGKNSGVGTIQGRFLPTDITVGGCTIGNGKVMWYFTEGRVTEDQLPPNYFGSGGVAEVPGLQEALIQIGHLGFKHHFAMTRGRVADQVIAELCKHPGYEVYDLRKVGG